MSYEDALARLKNLKSPPGDTYKTNKSPFEGFEGTDRGASEKSQLPFEGFEGTQPALSEKPGPRLTEEPDCRCLVCRPDLWPDGYREVLRAAPLWATQQFLLRVKWRMAGGLTQKQAERFTYLEIKEELRNRGTNEQG